VAEGLVGNRRIVVGEVFADRYELEELVGSGGMSSVYRARDTLLERHVALKILHAHYNDDGEYVERFRREARAVARLTHPNIVTVIDRGVADDRQFIVFEYVEGENLKELIERTGPLPVRRIVEIGLQMAHGLAFAHEHGLVHRDVKPQNVLLNEAGEVKVTDFGIARSLDVDHGMTLTGTVLGTSNYIAPEQANGRHVEPRTDVYSLGVVLFELLDGEVPFPGDNFVSVAMKHVNEPPPDLVERRPDVPPRLAAAIDRALAKRPEDRFPTMDDFADELEVVLDELGPSGDEHTLVVPGPVVRESRPHRIRTRRRLVQPLLLGLLAVLALAAVLAGALALGGSGGGDHKSGSTGGGGGGAQTQNVSLDAVKDFDPYSADHSEHPEAVPDATDGNPSTYWTTEHYDAGLAKPGVGIVLDASGSVDPGHITLVTDTPGFTASIHTVSSPEASAPGPSDSAQTVVGRTATFDLEGRSSRYFLLWISDLGGLSVAHVNEIQAG
jgi:serine/threonine-protein kinase